MARKKSCGQRQEKLGQRRWICSICSQNSMPLSFQLDSIKSFISYGKREYMYFIYTGEDWGGGGEAGIYLVIFNQSSEELAACVNSDEPQQPHSSTTKKFLFLSHAKVTDCILKATVMPEASSFSHCSGWKTSSPWSSQLSVTKSFRSFKGPLILSPAGQHRGEPLTMCPQPSRASCAFDPYFGFGATSDKRQLQTSPQHTGQLAQPRHHTGRR